VAKRPRRPRPCRSSRSEIVEDKIGAAGDLRVSLKNCAQKRELLRPAHTHQLRRPRKRLTSTPVRRESIPISSRFCSRSPPIPPPRRASRPFHSVKTEMRSSEHEMRCSETVMRPSESEMRSAETEMRRSGSEMRSVEMVMRTAESEMQSSESEMRSPETVVRSVETVMRSVETVMRHPQPEMRRSHHGRRIRSYGTFSSCQE
jgi:hypothetical protein